MSTAVLLCVQSAVATAADAHTDSGGLHITAHLLHTVQDTSGQWCVERVMERETLSNNTEYQERLREGRIKGLLGDRARPGETDMMEELMTGWYQTRRADSYSNRLVWSDLDTVNIVNCAVSELFPSLATGE